MIRLLLPLAPIAAAYQGGLSPTEIAETHGCHPASVLNLLRRHGVPRRTLREAAALRCARGRQTKPWLGKRLSAQHRARIGRGGPRHARWSGGNHMRPWRHLPRVACEQCGGTQRLCSTHRNNDARDWRLANRAVLCVTCHRSHRKRQWWRSWRAGEKPLAWNGINGWSRQRAAEAVAA